MTLTDFEDEYDHFYSPRFTLELGPHTYRAADGRISGLTVETSIENASSVDFTLNERYDHEHGAFADEAENRVDEGMPVVVRLGYGETLRPMFRGQTSAVQPNFPSNGSPTLTIQAEDLSQQLTNAKRSESWVATTVSEVVEDVVSAYQFEGVSIDIPESADLQFETVFQEDTTDYRFLTDWLVDTLGFEFFVADGEFTFRDPDPLADPTLELEYGKSLRSFRPNREPADQPVGEVTVNDWDASGKAAIEASASVPNGGDDTHVRREPVETQREAERIAEATAYDLAPVKSGRCETIGLPEIRAGTVVRLEGLGRGFDGPYYVESTTHRMDDSGYTTSFDASQTDLFEGAR